MLRILKSIIIGLFIGSFIAGCSEGCSAPIESDCDTREEIITEKMEVEDLIVENIIINNGSNGRERTNYMPNKR